MNGSQEGGGALGVARGDAAPLLEFQEDVFHQMPQFVDVIVVLAGFFAITSWRNNHLHAGCLGVFCNRVGIVALVGQKTLSRQVFDQCLSLRAISHGTCRNNDSQRHTMRIHGQMYFCVSPPFVRPIASLPPIAPAAWACALT